MDDVIRVEDQFYILATTSMAGDRTRVLKHDDTFAVFDRYGDIQPVGLGEQGIYHEGTRFLSHLILWLGRDRPLLLSSTIKEDNAILGVDLTNPDMFSNGQVVVPRGTVYLMRSKFLWQGVCYERLRILNYGLFPVNVTFSLEFDADFADIFEVRGMKRERKGRRLPDGLEDGWVTLAYEGLDGVIRRTRLEFFPKPKQVSSSEVRYEIPLMPKGEATYFLTVSCEGDATHTPRVSYDTALATAASSLTQTKAQACDIYTSNEQVNDWLNRTSADLSMMISRTPEGPYPYAGVPWFSTVFGRDGIITALECLWVAPTMARGVLAYLAAMQARETIPEQEAQPGRILHEIRRGEMAALGEIPFERYYGSVDATPLFIILAGCYYERTGDRQFIESIWPNIQLALHWIDRYGDVDGDGFVEYTQQSPKGLLHQGWKDSKDAVFHTDGTLADGPIALCEVQGYVYAAKCWAAQLAALLGQPGEAAELSRQAQVLQEQFERVFWSEELSTYILALDGRKRPCTVRTSNAGHCLLAGIASRAHAQAVAQTLLAEDSFSGWGIRTVAASEVRYNPMSYHNGSIWPHDNALIACGLARYGCKEAVLKVFTGLFDASLFVDLHRMPELFCGFARRPGEGPTLYPVACAPQAWSAAAVFSLLQACLGLSVKAPAMQIIFSYPYLPEFLQEVQIKNLRVGDASVDLALTRHTQDVGINVLRREGDVEMVVVI